MDAARMAHGSKSRRRRWGALSRAALLIAAVALTLLCFEAPVSQAASKDLAPTPYMGWDTYFAFSSRYDEATVLEQASYLISSGLERDGYRLIWLDVGWWKGTRDSAGNITVPATEWPHGLAWLTHTLHAEGFKVGLYTDAGSTGCGGKPAGSYGHYQQDVNQFAAWGFDAVKVDFCGGDDRHLVPKTAYTAFHEAIVHNASHRPMLLDICVFPLPGQAGHGYPPFSRSAFSSYTFGPSDGTSWRTDTDVGNPVAVTFAGVLRNMDADATEPSAAGPGHWNDPDYLGPDHGMNAAQFQTQFSMWSMLAAPLMISDNLSNMSAASYATVTNKQMIAIDQDRLGRQATEVAADGDGEIFNKPLEHGQYAIALLDRGAAPITLSTTLRAIGVPAASSYTLADVWDGTSSTTTGAISVSIAPYSTVVYRVTPAG
jgi:alpha-galactosidase